MLVLSRKRDETITIDVEGLENPIEVTILKIECGKVKVGIRADPSVNILRSELPRDERIAAKVKHAQGL